MYLDHSGWKAAISPVKVGSHPWFGKNDECLSLFCCVVRLLHIVPKANYFPKQQKSKREHLETGTFTRGILAQLSDVSGRYAQEPLLGSHRGLESFHEWVVWQDWKVDRVWGCSTNR